MSEERKDLNPREKKNKQDLVPSTRGGPFTFSMIKARSVKGTLYLRGNQSMHEEGEGGSKTAWRKQGKKLWGPPQLNDL